VDAEAEAAKKKKELMDKEIQKVKDEYEEKQRKKKAKKSGKDDDKDKKKKDEADDDDGKAEKERDDKVSTYLYLGSYRVTQLSLPFRRSAFRTPYYIAKHPRQINAIQAGNGGGKTGEDQPRIYTLHR